MSQKKALGRYQFVTLMAMMISTVALAIDIMLPALSQIAFELAEYDANRAQLIVSALFLGFAVGQIVVGPVSDCYGRKPVVYISYLFFMVGCLLSTFAESYNMMLLGRVLQGVGASGPRVLSTAIIRDGYEGRNMARINSIVMAVFILVPIVAPAMGQAIVISFGWRGCFGFLFLISVTTLIWFAMRQPETLSKLQRRVFSIANIWAGILEICRIPAAVGCTLSSGVLFGAFLGYLNTSQQIFAITYERGHLFSFYFGLAALAIGLAAMINSRLVMSLGMRLLAHRACYGVCISALLFLFPVFIYQGIPPFSLFMLWLMVTFFCIGILFGNLNALAMQPLGHMSGLGAAFVGSVSTFVSLPLGWLIGHQYDGSVKALVFGFLILGLVAFGMLRWAGHKS